MVHPSLQIFAVMRQNRGNYTLPCHLWCHFSDLTWLKQPWLGPHEAKAKHSRSATRPKLPWWKQNVKKIQHSGSDKKPSVLETRTVSTNSAKTHAAQSQIPEGLQLG